MRIIAILMLSLLGGCSHMMGFCMVFSCSPVVR